MKIFIKKVHVKTVPCKFKPLKNILKFITVDHKRLTYNERITLEVELLKLKIKDKDKLAWELIKDGKFDRIECIKFRDGSEEYRVIFKGLPAVKCNPGMIASFKQSEIKEVYELK